MAKSLRQKTWDDFSKMRRLEEADWRGTVTCVTCQKKMHWKESQLGHFLPGRHSSTLFDVRNSSIQCPQCNVFKHGNLAEYYPYMLKKYGQEVIDELKRKNNETYKYKKSELEYMRKTFKAKIAELNK